MTTAEIKNLMETLLNAYQGEAENYIGAESQDFDCEIVALAEDVKFYQDRIDSITNDLSQLLHQVEQAFRTDPDLSSQQIEVLDRVRDWM